MSEKIPSFEHRASQHETRAEMPKTHEKASTSEKKHGNEAEASIKLHELRKTINELPADKNPKEALKASGNVFTPVQNGHVSGQLKKIALRRELKLVRSQLSPINRTISKLVHQPIIRVVSEVTDKTAGRPSGLLGGGLVAFIGTTAYYYMSVHVGFRYNYSVFFALFVGGFVLGLCLEFLVWLALGRYKKSH